MSFSSGDWSNYSYKEVISMLEEYRSSYSMNAEDTIPQPMRKEQSDE